MADDRIFEFLVIELFIFELLILEFLARLREAELHAELPNPGIHPQPTRTGPRSKSEPYE